MSVSGYLSASANVEYTTIGCTVLSEDIDTGLDLFSSIILEPTFPKKDFKRLKKQVIGEIKQSYADPSFIARKHALHALFGAKSRFGRERTERNIKKITVEDVRNLYQNNFLQTDLSLQQFFSGEILLQSLLRLQSLEG